MTAAQVDWSKRVEAWLKWACSKQSVPVKMTDPVALAKIADILLEGREKRTSGEK